MKDPEYHLVRGNRTIFEIVDSVSSTHKPNNSVVDFFILESEISLRSATRYTTGEWENNLEEIHLIFVKFADKKLHIITDWDTNPSGDYI